MATRKEIESVLIQNTILVTKLLAKTPIETIYQCPKDSRLSYSVNSRQSIDETLMTLQRMQHDPL